MQFVKRLLGQTLSNLEEPNEIGAKVISQGKKVKSSDQSLWTYCIKSVLNKFLEISLMILFR